MLMLMLIGSFAAGASIVRSVAHDCRLLCWEYASARRAHGEHATSDTEETIGVAMNRDYDNMRDSGAAARARECASMARGWREHEAETMVMMW